PRGDGGHRADPSGFGGHHPAVLAVAVLPHERGREEPLDPPDLPDGPAERLAGDRLTVLTGSADPVDLRPPLPEPGSGGSNFRWITPSTRLLPIGLAMFPLARVRPS